MRALGFDVKKQEVLKILRDYDKDSQGLIEFDDFNKVMSERIMDRDPIEEMRKAFQLFDDDGTGIPAFIKERFHCEIYAVWQRRLGRILMMTSYRL